MFNPKFCPFLFLASLPLPPESAGPCAGPQGPAQDPAEHPRERSGGVQCPDQASAPHCPA
eukprot:scaffold34221_cov101-Isochrysis_galbana.AAC.3